MSRTLQEQDADLILERGETKWVCWISRASDAHCVTVITDDRGVSVYLEDSRTFWLSINSEFRDIPETPVLLASLTAIMDAEEGDELADEFLDALRKAPHEYK